MSVTYYRVHRAWVAEQLWFGRLCRASARPRMGNVPLWRVAAHARLSPRHLIRVLAVSGPAPRGNGARR